MSSSDSQYQVNSKSDAEIGSDYIVKSTSLGMFNKNGFVMLPEPLGLEREMEMILDHKTDTRTTEVEN